MESDDRIAEVWTEHRSYLVDLAFRMLGDVGEAEDVVQEAFSRLIRTGLEAIEDPRGWLIVVTSRLCLDQIGSARSRCERVRDDVEAVGPARSPVFPDPADRVTLDDSVGLALLVVLQRLTPAERVVFVLHDVFQLPFDSVAETVGRPAPSCRQLARRARTKIESGRTRFDVAAREHRRVTETFIAACTNGSLDGLLEVLHPQVSGEVDLGAGVPVPGVVVGAEAVARNLLRYWGRGATLVSQPLGGQPAVLGFVDRRLAGVLALTMRGELIGKIHVIADPSKLEYVRTQLAGLGRSSATSG